MNSILDTAYEIVKKAGPMRPIKLQKLCYYAQAWSLVWDDVALFEEEFEAWRNGPVCPKLYRLIGDMEEVDLSRLPKPKTSLGQDALDTIDTVLSEYGKKDGLWLSNLSKMEDPWREASHLLMPDGRAGSIISKERMKEYYGALE